MLAGIMRFSLRSHRGLAWLCSLAAVIPALPGSARAQAAAYTVVDYYSSYVVDQHNGDEARPIASLTKIATACVALDWAARTRHDLGMLVTVPPGAVQTGGVNPLGLAVGDQISLRDALYAALMSSDNIAALTVANAVGSDLARQRGENIQPVTAFVREMNALAESLDMRDTRFRDPHGLGDPRGRQSVSTANDLARLTIYALGQASFRFYSSQVERNVQVQGAGGVRRLTLHNTNEALGRNGVDGVKTGQTAAAGPCVILSAPRDATVMRNGQGQEQVQPHRLIVVVLNSPNRFADGLGLLQNGWGRYDAWLQRGRPVIQAHEMLRRAEAGGARRGLRDAIERGAEAMGLQR